MRNIIYVDDFFGMFIRPMAKSVTDIPKLSPKYFAVNISYKHRCVPWSESLRAKTVAFSRLYSNTQWNSRKNIKDQVNNL